MSDGENKKNPAQPSEAKPAVARKKPRRWLRRIGYTFLALFLLLVIFHRPILIAVIHTVAVKVAAKQHIKLSLNVEGTVLTNLSLKNIRALPDGNGPSPIEQISIDEITVRYSIPSLVRKGVSEFLKSYALKNGNIEVKPVEGTKEQKHDLASTLHDIIQQPALFSDRVDVENLNLVAHTPDGDFALQGASIFLDPVVAGSVEIKRLQVPQIRTWENLRATTTYAKRDLILRGLQIDPEIIIEQFELDASRRAEGINRLAVDGQLFGGSAQFSMLMRELPGKHENNAKKADVKIESRIADLSLEKVSNYFHAQTPAIGSITSSTLTLEGDPNVPAGWNGLMNMSTGAMHLGPAIIDNTSVQLNIQNGAMVLNAELNSGRNHFTAQAQSQLPASMENFSKMTLDGRLDIDASELSRFAKQITQGSVSGNGTFALRNQLFTAQFDVNAKEIAAENFAVASGEVKLDAKKKLPQQTAQQQQKKNNTTPAQQQQEQQSEPPFDGLQTRLNAGFEGIRADKYAVDSVALNLSTDNENVQLQTLTLSRGENKIDASGSATLPRDMKSWETMPAEAKFTVNVPSLAAFNAETDLAGPNARIEANGDLSNGANGYNGKISLDVTSITFRDFAADKLSLDATIAQGVATINALTFALNPSDGFSASGRVGLQKPFVYDAKLQAQIRDLSKFSALAPDVKGGFAGALALDWSGSGNIEQLQNSGDVRLKLDNGKVGDEVRAIFAEIAGSYSPEFIDVPTFWITSSRGDIAMKIGAGNEEIKISDIAVKLGNKPVLGGSISLPLDLRTPKNPETLIPTSGPVAVNLKTTELNLEALPTLESGGSAEPKKAETKTDSRAVQTKSAKEKNKPSAPVSQKAQTQKTEKANGTKGTNGSGGGMPVRGTITATLTAGGTLDALDATLSLAGRGLQAKSTPKLAPASVDLDARLVSDQLSIKGRVQQPAISPVEIAGTLPLPVKQIVKQKKIDEQSPVQLSIRLPRSSLAFISQVAPAVRFVEGTMSANVDVAGTIAQPQLSGATLVDLSAVRFTNADLPSLNAFRADVRFAGNKISVNRVSGDIAGGTVNLSGVVQLPKLTEPVFDLRFTAQNALLMRNESLTVRADSDIRITGPLAGGSIAGSIGITHSRFFKEIEILPIELPGRPAPKPPATSTGFSLGPPLDKWKFDVKIKTEDPFGIRGNLANGQAVVNLALVGTGKSPALDGSVQIEKFDASLPFSQLHVNTGFVYFSPDEPFTPKLDIQAASSMQDYNISVYIYGTADDPKTVFSSEPPLPQEDIIALLATGVTASQLTGAGGGDVLAGRAAALLFQRIYHKFFKQRAPAENESIASRFKVDVGGVDPRTGQQEVGARFKLADDFYLVGDLDVSGNIRGQLKYLLRFR